MQREMLCSCCVDDLARNRLTCSSFKSKGFYNTAWTSVIVQSVVCTNFRCIGPTSAHAKLAAWRQHHFAGGRGMAIGHVFHSYL